MTFLISSVSFVISPFYFLILLIWVLSLCPLVSLDKGLSILLIFSKNQLLVWLILWIVLFVSNWLILALNLVISCCLNSWVYLLLFVLHLSDVLSSWKCMLSPVSFRRHSELWVFLLGLLSLCPISLGMLWLLFI